MLKCRNKKKKKNFKYFNFFLVYVTSGIPPGFLKKCQPIWSSRLVGYREHINKCLVLLYRIVLLNPIQSKKVELY